MRQTLVVAKAAAVAAQPAAQQAVAVYRTDSPHTYPHQSELNLARASMCMCVCVFFVCDFFLSVCFGVGDIVDFVLVVVVVVVDGSLY